MAKTQAEVRAAKDAKLAKRGYNTNKSASTPTTTKTTNKTIIEAPVVRPTSQAEVRANKDAAIAKYGYTKERSFGKNTYDSEAYDVARNNFMDWMLNTSSSGGANNAKYGYDWNDPEDVERFNNRQISKKYEASYSSNPYDQWLKANGQASMDFFDDKYYAKAYSSVMADRAQKQAVQDFKKAVGRELVTTANDAEHPTNDEIAEAVLRIQKTDPRFASIEIVNPKNTEPSYDNYFSPVLAQQEAEQTDIEKRSNALYLDDVSDYYYALWDAADRKARAAQPELDPQAKMEKDVYEAERRADINRLGNQILGLDYTKESGQRVKVVSQTPLSIIIDKAQAIANMGTAAREGFSPIASRREKDDDGVMRNYWQEEHQLSDAERVVLDAAMATTTQQLMAQGYSENEIHNYFRRADLGEYIDPEDAMRVALTASGMDAADVQAALDSYTDEDWANAQKVALDLAAIEGVENSTLDQFAYSVISMPVTAAFKTAASFANLADMIGGDPDWGFVEAMNEKAARWEAIGHDSNHKALSTMSEVGSEIFRILAISKLGALAGGVSAATSGMSWFVSQAAQSVPFVASAMGSYYGEAKAGGADHKQATKYALIAGTVEGILEKLAIGDVMQTHLGSKMFSKKLVNGTGISKEIFTKYGLPLADILVSSVGEGIEESLSYVASGLARRGSWDNNYKMSWDEAGENFMGGLLIGGIMSGLAAPADSQRYKYAAKMLEQTGTYTTDLDSLYAASYFETLPAEQQRVLTEQYNNGEIIADKATRKEATKAERELDAINREVAAKKEVISATEKDARNKREQADNKVENIKQRIATLQETDHIKKAKAIKDLSGRLEAANKARSELYSETEKKLKTAQSEYAAVVDKKTSKAADLEETIAKYQAAKYFDDFYGKAAPTAINAASAPQTIEPTTNSTETTNAPQSLIDTVKTEAVEVAEPVVAETVEVPTETAIEADTVANSEPVLKDLGANTPTPVEMAESKVYSNTYDKWLTDAEKLADDTGNAWYARSKERDTLADAKSVVEGSIRRNGNLDSVIAQLQDKNAWDATDVDTAMLIAETLRSEAATTGDYTKLNEWKNVIRQNMTQSGQAIQALAKWTRNSSIAAEAALDKAVDNINKKNKKKIDAGKATAVEVNPELMAELQAAETDEQREEAVNKIAADIGAKMPVGLADKINAWRYLSMLGNPRTMIRNLVGNEIMSDVLWVGKDAVGTLLESGLDQSQRTKSLMFGDEYKANRDYATSTLKEAKNKLEGSSRYDTKKGVEKAIAESTPVFNLKPVEAWRKGTNWALTKGDTVFLEKQYKRSFAQIMTARGYTPDTITAAQKKECMDYAIAEAQRSTFHDASKVADAISKLESSHAAAKVLVGGVMPFKKTPINVLARGVEFSPIGLVQGTTQLLTKVKSGGMSAAQAVDKISAGLTGSALMALGFFLAKSGIITGGNEDEDKYYVSDLGHQEFALNLGGGKSVTIDWAAPATIPLFMGAALNSVIDGEGADGENKFDAFINTLSGITDPLVEMSMLQGLQDTLESAAEASSNDESVLWSMAKNAGYNYVSSFVPTAGGQIARTIDPVRRDTTGDPTSEMGKELDKVTNKIQAKIPGVASNLEPYINVWGEKEINEHSWPVRLLENSILPGYLDETDMTPVDVEITRLYSETQNPDVIPSNYPYRTLKDTKTKDSYVLSNKEFTAFKEENGKAMYAAALDATNDPMYSRMDDDEKVALIADAIGDAQNSVLKKYKKKYLNKD